MNHIVKGLVAGLVATIVLSMLMIAKGMMGLMPELDMIAMLSSMMSAPPIVGWIAHLMIGAAIWGGLFAFQAAVFTRDLNSALRVYKRVDATAVMVNDHSAFRVDGMPFAGLRQSGLGVGGIPYTIDEMRINKMLVLHSPEL